MKNRIVDDEIVLVRYYPNYRTTLAWYQDVQLCKQVDNRDAVYDLELLERMYQYLMANKAKPTPLRCGLCLSLRFRFAVEVKIRAGILVAAPHGVDAGIGDGAGVDDLAAGADGVDHAALILIVKTEGLPQIVVGQEGRCRFNGEGHVLLAVVYRAAGIGLAVQRDQLRFQIVYGRAAVEGLDTEPADDACARCDEQEQNNQFLFHKRSPPCMMLSLYVGFVAVVKHCSDLR